MFGLERATVLITGASGNLGRAAVEAFAATGAQLVLASRRSEVLERLAAPLGARALVVEVDLVDPRAAEAMVMKARARFGRIDVLFNTVGGFAGGKPLHEEAPATWDRLYDLNLRTVLNACRAVIPVMLEQRSGCILNTASSSALRGSPNFAAYAATKSMVVRLTESLASELRPFGIRVNAIAPGTLDTPENRTAMPDADPGDWIDPSSVAELAVILSTPDAARVSGAVIPVKAGG